MSATQQPDSYIAEADYLAAEQQSEVRHEYVDGHVYAMAGASKRYNRIARNLITRMQATADDLHCDLFFID